MGHAIHFLTRLERVSDEEQLELAKSLYRDPELLKYVLRRARLPQGAERAAIALGGEDGPRLVVTREGQVVTCLGEGMRCDLPAVARAHLDALAQQNAVLRERLELARRLAGPGNERKLVKRLNAGCRVSREEFLANTALLPFYERNLPSAVAGIGYELEDTRAELIRCTSKPLERLSPPERELIVATWDTMWAIGHLALLSAAGERETLERSLEKIEALGDADERYQLYWPSMSLGPLGITWRGTWAVAKVGRSALLAAKRAFLEPSRCYAMLDGAFALLGLAARHQSLRPEVERIFARARTKQPIYAALESFAVRALADKENLVQVFLDLGRQYCMDMAPRLAPGSPYRFERKEDVPDDLALAFHSNNYLSFRGADDAMLGLTFRLAPVAARARAEDFYLPADLLEALFSDHSEDSRLFCAYDLIKRWVAPLAKPAPTLVERRAGPNAPCPCRSGRKFKRCCGLK